ncbi:pilus assembly protein PilP [Halomonas campisalis]|uniref:Pilus assembly protein PilP n=2 Tax=Billgrantia campisalis TaxID=74661 RepID=A0ABS9PB79_9GAMM|nr:pilus assembly protein PilP [Halomonas campisalis]
MASRRPWAGLFGVGLLALAGCVDPQLDELDRELAAIRTDPGAAPRLELPEVPSYEATPYREDDSRSPFVPRQQADERRSQAFSGELAPDPERPREPLERFALGELELVGILTVGGQPSALVRSPDGQVHRLQVGNRLGENRGRIVSITQSTVELVETVMQREGWVEQRRRLTLSE